MNNRIPRFVRLRNEEKAYEREVLDYYGERISARDWLYRIQNRLRHLMANCKDSERLIAMHRAEQIIETALWGVEQEERNAQSCPF